MSDFERMYFLLFNAVTDALELLEEEKPRQASELLRRAQLDAEEIYIETE